MKAKLLAAILLIGSLSANAQSSCSATNDNGDANCSISCSIGQAAVCSNSTGSNSPSCACEGSADFSSVLKRASRASGKFFTLAGKAEAPDLSSLFKNSAVPVQVKPFSSATTASRVEQTDVLHAMNQKLAGLPDFSVGRSCNKVVVDRVCEPVGACTLSVHPLGSVLSNAIAASKELPGAYCGMRCFPVYGENCHDVMGKLTASYPLTVQEEPRVEISEPNWNSLPSQVFGNRQRYVNCTTVTQRTTYSHTETTKIGVTVSKTKVLKSSESNSAGITAKVSFKMFDLGGSASRTVNQEVTITDGAQQVNEETINLSLTLPMEVPPMSLVTLDHSWIRRDAPVGFSGTVILDAPIAANRASKSRISDVLPTVSDRTFAFSGTVVSAFTSEGQTQAVQRKLNESECLGNLRDGLTVTAEPYN